jgi:hypothetical protein
MGDVHGHLELTLGHLRQAGLIDASDAWIGRDAVLWFVGDLVDRGPDGRAAIDLVGRLEVTAPRDGGCANTVLGNHDLLLLAARRFRGPHDLHRFEQAWRTGGAGEDLDRLTDEQAEWLASRAAMAREGDWLIVHADSELYLRQGRSVTAVNAHFGTLTASPDPADWGVVLDAFGEHSAFHRPGIPTWFLDSYGGVRIVHGHTPITSMAGTPPEGVTGPLIYARGLCVNVDGGMYLGGPGFLARLDDWPEGGGWPPP